MISTGMTIRSQAPAAVAAAAPTVFVIDSDHCVRGSLEAAFLDAGWNARSFASAHQFLSEPRVFAPSCLVIEAELADGDGLALQRHIVATRSDMPVIVITHCLDVAKAVQAMKAGAADFLIKPLSNAVVLDAVRKLIAQSDAALCQEAKLDALRRRYASLSRREREVMDLVVAGLLNKQVGGELGISETTVKAHRGRVMQKMATRSLADLVRMAAMIGVAPARS